jgi:hypothetical protein
MSPTVFREKGYRFYFLSNEERRVHIHIECQNGEAKFWIEPVVALAHAQGLNKRVVYELFELVTRHKNEIIKKWLQHFGC